MGSHPVGAEAKGNGALLWFRSGGFAVSATSPQRSSVSTMASTAAWIPAVHSELRRVMSESFSQRHPALDPRISGRNTFGLEILRYHVDRLDYAPRFAQLDLQPPAGSGLNVERAVQDVGVRADVALLRTTGGAIVGGGWAKSLFGGEFIVRSKYSPVTEIQFWLCSPRNTSS